MAPLSQAIPSPASSSCRFRTKAKSAASWRHAGFPSAPCSGCEPAITMRNRYVLLADVPLIAIAAVAAFAVRFDWRFYDQRPEFPAFVIAAMIVKPAAFLLTGMYRRYWKYASVEELLLV